MKASEVKDELKDQQGGSTALAVVTEGAVQAPPDMSKMFEDSAEAGRDFAPDEVAIPYLTALQPKSPQVDVTQVDKLIEGAVPGMIFNTVTKELFNGRETGLVIVPADSVKMFVEWVPLSKGGGFVAQYTPDDPIVATARVVEDTEGKKRNKLPSGNDLVETDYHYVVYRDARGVVQWAIIAMTSSQLKTSRVWGTVQAGQPERTKDNKRFPCFAYQYTFKTKIQTKNNYSWFGWDITSAGIVNDPEVFLAAKTYYTAVRAGTARATAPPVDHPDAAEKAPF